MDTVRAVEMRYVIQIAIVHTAEKNYKRTLPIWWQNNILHVMSLLEQRGYFIISKSCNNLIAINIVSCHLLSNYCYYQLSGTTVVAELTEVDALPRSEV